MLTRLLVWICVCCLLGRLLCNIDPYKCYNWYAGIRHGMFIVPNFIRYLFDHSVCVKAPCCTTAYNVLYWIFGVPSILSTLFGGTRKR